LIILATLMTGLSLLRAAHPNQFWRFAGLNG
jgi:hypothetical protein